MSRLYLAILILFSVVPAFSQVRLSDAEVILQSRHIWRGQKLGTAPAIEPSFTLSSARFSFNFWASVTTNNSYSEIDLIPAYQFNDFKLTLFDYYNPVPEGNNQYLNFKEGRNRHSLELAVDNYSVEKQRLKWMVGTFLLGDKNKSTGNPFYSTYIELKYPFIVWNIETEPFVGITPFKGYYADQFTVINTGISFGKQLTISQKLMIPFRILVGSNPYKNNQFFTFSTGIVFVNLK